MAGAHTCHRTTKITALGGNSGHTTPKPHVAAKADVEKGSSNLNGKKALSRVLSGGVCRPIHTATNHLMNKHLLKYCRRNSQCTHLWLKSPVLFSRAQIHWVDQCYRIFIYGE